MKTLFQHIEHIQGKPHHVRKRIALASAVAGSALVALVWLVGGSVTGAFAIQGSDFAMTTGQTETVATTSASGIPQNLAGAAAAVQDAKAPAHIEIVDTAPASPTKKQSDQTILPF